MIGLYGTKLHAWTDDAYSVDDPFSDRPRSADTELTEDEMLAYFSGKIARWQIPDRAIFVATLPRNATGKLMKTKLREEYGNILRAVERS